MQSTVLLPSFRDILMHSNCPSIYNIVNTIMLILELKKLGMNYPVIHTLSH
jgi:hypothetical protein